MGYVAGCGIVNTVSDPGEFVDELSGSGSGDRVGLGAVAFKKIGMIKNHTRTNSMKPQRA